MVKPFFYTKSQIEKIGNAIVYLATHITDLNKTKLLKLLYLIEETSIQKYAFPFFNIRFDVWKFGPVCKDIFVELSDAPDLLSNYISLEKNSENSFIKSLKEFSDDEFSDNDLSILEYISSHYKNASASQLVNLTHSKHSPWYQTALKNGLLEYFDLGLMNSTDVEIDFSLIFQDENRKEFYKENKELLAFSQQLKS